MRALIGIYSAALVIAGAAFSLEPPKPELLERFFRSRLSNDLDWDCVAECLVIQSGDTALCAFDSSAVIGAGAGKFSFQKIQYSLSFDEFFLPIRLAEVAFDSILVNKTRVRYEEEMCWKARIYCKESRYEALFSADGFFRLKMLETKGGGKSRSSDIWHFVEVAKGKDLPKSLSRTVEFGWGGGESRIISKIELFDLRKIAPQGDSPQ